MATRISFRQAPNGNWVMERWHLTGTTPSSTFPCLSRGELEMIQEQIDIILAGGDPTGRKFYPSGKD